jgi:hypothetical protein
MSEWYDTAQKVAKMMKEGIDTTPTSKLANMCHCTAEFWGKMNFNGDTAKAQEWLEVHATLIGPGWWEVSL